MEEAEGNEKKETSCPRAHGPADEEGRARERRWRRRQEPGKRLSPVPRPTLLLPPTLILVILLLQSLRSETWGLGGGSMACN